MIIMIIIFFSRRIPFRLRNNLAKHWFSREYFLLLVSPLFSSERFGQNTLRRCYITRPFIIVQLTDSATHLCSLVKLRFAKTKIIVIIVNNIVGRSHAMVNAFGYVPMNGSNGVYHVKLCVRGPRTCSLWDRGPLTALATTWWIISCSKTAKTCTGHVPRTECK